MQHEFFQFNNLYGQLKSSWQTWKNLVKNTRLGYDPDAKTFTLDDDRWNEVIKFEEELDNLFIGNTATIEKAWAPTSNEPISSERPIPTNGYHYTCSEFMESFNSTTILSDATDMMDKLKQANGKN